MMKNSFEGGVIGDAWGSSFEFESVVDYSNTYIFGELSKEKNNGLQNQL